MGVTNFPAWRNDVLRSYGMGKSFIPFGDMPIARMQGLEITRPRTLLAMDHVFPPISQQQGRNMDGRFAQIAVTRQGVLSSYMTTHSEYLVVLHGMPYFILEANYTVILHNQTRGAKPGIPPSGFLLIFDP